ncbi:MAG: glycosyltransferase [Actinobacteria bacterium]|uniref:Unannotated protein n=1 Tax=freshwater metagenome TaxID=449393 RepID=A0A6J7HRE9_9ZZZZ|nr:glycosyltransferase family 2 protein [Actinomycetota bacterium]MSW47531.1 glycosyltransferase [Actinomycetota bacterium]MSX24898.1 glycosyltransferase [Actinomycetota bacterium]MSY45868.1 glycosyltransferase [Actinomycetota bacterium]MSY57124.1 glycosyltransferase [Actinomycetota bacterium]
MNSSNETLFLSPEEGGPIFPGVSVILPVLNEALHLEESIGAILSQDYLGNFEIVLALGPSKDETAKIAALLSQKDPRIILVENPTGRTAAGLNLAIASSHFPIIVRVDGHAQIPTHYISLAVEILRKTGAANVGGLMAAEGATPFERAVATAMRSPFGVGSSNFHTGGQAGSVDTVYLGTFIRSAVQSVGGFNESFIRAQDWELNFRLRQAGGIIYFDPRLEVKYRPRPTIRALAKQYFEYGRWRRVVARTHKGTVNLRYLAPPFTLLASILSLASGFFISPYLFLPVGVYVGFLLISSAAIGNGIAEKIRLPAILATMQMCWGAGFITSLQTLNK